MIIQISNLHPRVANDLINRHFLYSWKEVKEDDDLLSYTVELKESVCIKVNDHLWLDKGGELYAIKPNEFYEVRII